MAKNHGEMKEKIGKGSGVKSGKKQENQGKEKGIKERKRQEKNGKRKIKVGKANWARDDSRDGEFSGNSFPKFPLSQQEAFPELLNSQNFLPLHS